MKYNDFRQKAITIREANIIIDILKSYKIEIKYLKDIEYKEFKYNTKGFNYTKYALVVETESNIWIETKWYEPKYKATRYICNLNNELKPEISGLHAFNKLQQYCFKAMNAKKYGWDELERLYDKETGRYICSAGPLVGFNPKYEGVELHDVYEYDLNSAYSSIMLNKIPYVNRPYYNKIVGKNQIGFALDDQCSMIKEGQFAQIVFDLIELKPEQRAYIEKLYSKKHDSTNELEKAGAKLMLNASIGYYQRWNPFVRAYIVHRCNEFIKGLLDDDSVLWNTDAIFSLKRRPELELGASIGEFKEEHIERFAYKGNNYQINWDLPKYRGIPKAWYKKGWDILKDSTPKRCNKYIFDQSKMRLVRNEEYHEKEID